MKSFLVCICLIVIAPIGTSANEETIALVDKSCVLSGPDSNSSSIKTTEGAKGTSFCKIKKDEYRCSYSPNDKNSKVTEIILKYLRLNKESTILSNNDGNIKVFINPNKKTFSWGQTVALIEQGIVINKYCVGVFLDAKELAQILKEESKKDSPSNGK